jgi:hypothetical protein
MSCRRREAGRREECRDARSASWKSRSLRKLAIRLATCRRLLAQSGFTRGRLRAMSFTRREPEGRAGARRTALTMSCLRERRARPESRNRDRPRRELLDVRGTAPCAAAARQEHFTRRPRRARRARSTAVQVEPSAPARRPSPATTPTSNDFGVGIQAFAAPRAFTHLRVLRASACNAVHKAQQQVHAEARRTRRTAFGGEFFAPQKEKRLLGSWMARKLAPPPESRRREQSSAPPRPSSASA